MSTLVTIEDLEVWFPQKGKDWVKAVDGVSFEINKGEKVGLVGESGSGKSTIANAIMKLVKSRKGKIFYKDQDILQLTEREFRPLRSEIQMVFQDPSGSLNPRMLVQDILREPLELHRDDLSKKDYEATVGGLLESVGLSKSSASKYPHEFSGGQKQRIGIARALAVDPEFIVLDEPVSALDVSVQAMIVNLLDDLADDLGLTYLFVAHDLALVEHFTDQVLVMHHGKIVESASSDKIYQDPQNDYTKQLLSAVPKLEI